MAKLHTLPVEILCHIFSHADQVSQKALRLTNRQLGDIGKRSVFQAISVTTSDESLERLNHILERPDLISHTTKIYLNTFDPMDEEVNVWSGYYDPDPYDDVAVRLFHPLEKIPRLQSVVLRFHPECPEDADDDVPQSQAFRAEVMKYGLVAFVAMPHLKDLALRDLENVNFTDTEAIANLNKLLPRLRSLRLNIANVNGGADGSSDYYEREASHTFFSDLPSFWLKPALSNLEHLTLYSDIYVGFVSKCDFRGLHFPKLKTLALGNHAFIHDSQRDWILSHGETLSELYMDNCAIIFEATVYPKTIEHSYLPPHAFKPHPRVQQPRLYTRYDSRWADYFRAFKDKLPRLQHFRYGSARNWWEHGSTPFESEGRVRIGFRSESYMVCCDGRLPREYDRRMLWQIPKEDGEVSYVHGSPLNHTDDDETALEELCAKVGLGVNLDEDY